MSKQQISDAYLREFFGIGDDEEGQAELAELKPRLERLQFRHREDIITIDSEADGLYFLESGTAVVLDRDGATLRIFPGEDGEQFAEFRAELGDKQFVQHLDKGGYLAEISGIGRLSLIRFLDGAVLGGAEYEPR